MLERIANWWAGPQSPVNLGVFRATMFATLFLFLNPLISAHFGPYPAILCFPPGVWKQWVDRFPVTTEAVWIVYAVFVPASFLAVVGLWTRASTIVATLTGTYLLSAPQFFGLITHYHHLVWFPLILSCSPCGDGFSLDAVRARARARRAGLPPPTRPWSGAYRLPLRCVVVLIAVAYFFPGLWKVVEGHFLDVENFRRLTWHKLAETQHQPLLRVDHLDWFLWLSLVGTLVLELLFLPLVVRHRWTRRLVMMMGVGFHLFVYLTVGIRMFWTLAASYSALIDWEGLGRRVMGARAAPAGEPIASRLPRRSMAPAAIVGFGLIFANIYEGIAKRQDWPLGCYPRYDLRYTGDDRGFLDHLEMRVTLADGRTRIVPESDLYAFILPSRAFNLCSKIENIRERQGERCEAYYTLWTHLDPSLTGAVRVEFWRQTLRTPPDEQRRIVNQVLLHVWESPKR